MQKGVQGTAARRFFGIGCSQETQVPYVPASSRLRANRTICSKCESQVEVNRASCLSLVNCIPSSASGFLSTAMSFRMCLNLIAAATLIVSRVFLNLLKRVGVIA